MPKICILSSVHAALDNRVFYREARSLQRHGYDVTLVAVHDRDESKDGVQIVALPRLPRWQRPRLWLALLRHAFRSQAGLFLFHDPELLLVTPWLRLLTGKPVVYDVHEAYADFIDVKDYLPARLRRPLAWLFRRLEPLLARLQSGLLFADDQVAASFARVRRPKATLFNFPERSFLEAAAAAPSGPSALGAGGPPYPALAAGEAGIHGREAPVPAVLYLGGLERNRGSRLLVEAFSRVYQEMPSARLWLVGHFAPPDLENEVRAGIARCGLHDAVTIVGRVPFEEIGAYLGRAAVGWVTWQPVPKNEKNIPTKLFEYMAYGLPVVCSDLASTRPYVEPGRSGYLVAAADPEAHAQAILALLRRSEEASAMGTRGRELVWTRFNWDEMERRLLALVQELLS